MRVALKTEFARAKSPPHQTTHKVAANQCGEWCAPIIFYSFTTIINLPAWWGITRQGQPFTRVHSQSAATTYQNIPAKGYGPNL